MHYLDSEIMTLIIKIISVIYCYQPQSLVKRCETRSRISSLTSSMYIVHTPLYINKICAHKIDLQHYVIIKIIMVINYRDISFVIIIWKEYLT